jgi:hypothetical protein
MQVAHTSNKDKIFALLKRFLGRLLVFSGFCDVFYNHKIHKINTLLLYGIDALFLFFGIFVIRIKGGDPTEVVYSSGMCVGQ